LPSASWTPQPWNSRRSASSQWQAAGEDLEVIRQLAERYGEDAIARVLNKLGR
jgi:hypothetical protein